MRDTPFVVNAVASAFLCAFLHAPGSGIRSASAAGLPERPESGVDPDVQAALTSAQQLLQSGQAEAAVQSVISLYAATDRYTAAQRQQLIPESQKVLLDASAQLQAAGRTEQAVLAQDAAWTIGGRAPSPTYSQTLTTLAEQAQKGSREESLYLARRARLADPGNPAAARLDERLSRNRFKIPGLVMVIGGAVIAGAGLLTFTYGNLYLNDTSGAAGSGKSFSTVELAGIGAALGGGLLAGGGGLLLYFGKPVGSPVSPTYLPALPESQP